MKLKLSGKTDENILSIFPIVDEENEYFKLRDGTYMDFVRIISKDLYSLSDDDLQYHIYQLEKFFKIYSYDFKIIGMNLPPNCLNQIMYLERLKNKTQNGVYKQIISDKLSELKWLEQNRTEKEYFLMFFFADHEKYKEQHNLIFTALDILVDEVSLEKKMKILYKLANKNIVKV